jgi:lipoprotein-anchoring transpeptidase ErfK/SrfK
MTAMNRYGNLLCMAILGARLASAQTLPTPLATNLMEAGAVTQAVLSISTTQLLAEAETLIGAQKPDKARDKLLAALSAATDEDTRRKVEERLGKLDVELVRLPWPMPEKIDYVVQAGDSIRAIAQKHGTTVELIVESNRRSRPDHIEPGDRMRIFNGKLAITVNKTRNELLVTCNGRFFKRYRVGTGKYGKTPVGTFIVSDRIKDPPWWRGDGKVVPFGDKENILGTRWLALKATGATPEVKGYGIHGTWENESVGKAESAGCIRLRNEEIEELFLLVPVGTEVVIEE